MNNKLMKSLILTAVLSLAIGSINNLRAQEYSPLGYAIRAVALERALEAAERPAYTATPARLSNFQTDDQRAAAAAQMAKDQATYRANIKSGKWHTFQNGE
jgi:hypothetical protein